MPPYVSGYDGQTDFEDDDYESSAGDGVGEVKHLPAEFWKRANEEELNARKMALEADPRLAADECAISPLVVAARVNFARLALRALSVGYTVDEQADDGRDAIRIAADHGYGRLVDMLIEHHSRARTPMTAVDIATMQGDATMVRRLKNPTIGEGTSIRNFYRTRARKLSIANRG
ncbi:hypothetical protein CYMTET_49144 [Cymbomonas tetramitiformis]|uniref:Uncharacterized protein n=1 Tax=Cymbomonas tetramitiformis TaxID=36881 RepID=A0AAE0BRW2_9CHLO|nr:hypothetical protein CYMTET_49144 [Cymbomonas tetramitiformis]